MKPLFRSTRTNLPLPPPLQRCATIFLGGIISLPMGMENGAPIGGKLENLQHFMIAEFVTSR
ncbi:MAG: hypothetical protein R3C26_26305 [Calditrichia bacterium]